MVKVLIFGDVRGDLNTLRERVSKLNNSAHGPFDVGFCAGEFFPQSNGDGNKEFLDQLQVAFPIPLYFLHGASPLSEQQKQLFGNNEGNFHILQDSGKTQVMGLTVCHIAGGIGGETEQQVRDRFELGSADTVDVLLTLEWPVELLDSADIDQQSKDRANASELVSKVTAKLAPRYHFAGKAGVFHQRAPYRNGPGKPVTRFIGLGCVEAGAPKARKWVHALKLEPLGAPAEEPSNTTGNPFHATGVKRSHPGDGMPPLLQPMDMPSGLSMERIRQLEMESRSNAGNPQFFYGNRDGSFRPGGQPQQPRRKEPRVAAREECWFCLASPACEQHLIVSIGATMYLTLPKGPAVEDHLLIVPISHEPCFATLSTEDLEEVVKTKAAITDFYATQNMVPMFFERNIIFGQAAQRHAYLEVIPIEKHRQDELEKILFAQADRSALRFEPLNSDGQTDGLAALQLEVCGNPAAEYFFVELPNGKAFINRVDADRSRGKLPLQFGRQVACQSRGCMGRVSWKSCLTSKSEEAKQAQQAKARFEPFNAKLAKLLDL